jgi:hypothetical protein
VRVARSWKMYLNNTLEEDIPRSLGIMARSNHDHDHGGDTGRRVW